MSYVVRIFDGRASAHVGPFRAEDTAQAYAERLARVASHRGLEANVSVRALHSGDTSAHKICRNMGMGEGYYSARTLTA